MVFEIFEKESLPSTLTPCLFDLNQTTVSSVCSFLVLNLCEESPLTILELVFTLCICLCPFSIYLYLSLFRISFPSRSTFIPAFLTGNKMGARMEIFLHMSDILHLISLFINDV